MDDLEQWLTAARPAGSRPEFDERMRRLIADGSRRASRWERAGRLVPAARFVLALAAAAGGGFWAGRSSAPVGQPADGLPLAAHAADNNAGERAVVERHPLPPTHLAWVGVVGRHESLWGPGDLKVRDMDRAGH